jgi:Cof subfamily protein (haloacid dehalogenase superfamily)
MSDVLYVSDLDGTLLHDDATLSSHTRRRLTALLDEGLPFTVATARSHASMRHILGDLPLPLPVIEFNGAFLSDLATGRHLWINDLTEPGLARTMAAIEAHDLAPFVSTFDGTDDRLYAPPPEHAGMQWYIDDRQQVGDRRLRLVEDVRVGLQERVVCLTVIDRRERLAPLAQQLSAIEEIDVCFWHNTYSPEWHWISVHDHRATKDRAVGSLVDYAGLAGVEVVAFGDQSNDVAMIAAADRGIAMANAIDAVKEVADLVIGANVDDSVIDFIEQDWRARS